MSNIKRIDRLAPSERSSHMAKIRSRDTKPELIVRRLLYRLGYRYRLHIKHLPGTPDIAFIGRKKVIFIHGCFWHGHNCSSGRNRPRSNIEYWNSKFLRNIERDELNQKALTELDWKYLIVWECQIRDEELLRSQLINFLGQ